MANQMICLDTSILIDFFRKTNKENSAFYRISSQHTLFAVSVITEYEIFTGTTPDQLPLATLNKKHFERIKPLSLLEI